MQEQSQKLHYQLQHALIKIALETFILIIKNLPDMSQEIDDLKAEVAQDKTVQQSAITLLTGLHDRLVKAGTDKAALKSITDDLKSNREALAASVTANTVAENEPGTGTGAADGGTGNGDTTNADGSVTHADGTTTHPDGSVTAADGTVITGPTNG